MKKSSKTYEKQRVSQEAIYNVLYTNMDAMSPRFGESF